MEAEGLMLKWEGQSDPLAYVICKSCYLVDRDNAELDTLPLYSCCHDLHLTFDSGVPYRSRPGPCLKLPIGDGNG